jgi:hypothetical protein
MFCRICCSWCCRCRSSCSCFEEAWNVVSRKSRRPAKIGVSAWLVVVAPLPLSKTCSCCRIRRCFGCSLQAQTIDQLHNSLFDLGSFGDSARARLAIFEKLLLLSCILRCFGCSLQAQTINQLHTSIFDLGSFGGARPFSFLCSYRIKIMFSPGATCHCRIIAR